jgi:hypothetical protein
VIEVVVVETGDTAEADTPEAAILAARTMLHDARAGYQAPTRHVRFYVDGLLVREASERSLW